MLLQTVAYINNYFCPHSTYCLLLLTNLHPKKAGTNKGSQRTQRPHWGVRLEGCGFSAPSLSDGTNFLQTTDSSANVKIHKICQIIKYQEHLLISLNGWIRLD